MLDEDAPDLPIGDKILDRAKEEARQLFRSFYQKDDSTEGDDIQSTEDSNYNKMIRKFQQFGSDVKYEMSKVSWPDWNDLKGSSYVVLVFSLILTLYLFLVDLLLSKSISTIM